MMCRVIAPLAALFTREAASRPSLHRLAGDPSRLLSPLHRRLRIVRHRLLRWFGEPVAIVERERRERELDPSVWRYDFRPRPALQFRRLERAAKHVA